MKTKRVRQTTLVALIAAVLTLGVAPSASADTWLGYGDNYKTKETCTNRGVYLLRAQPYPNTRFMDYHCQGSNIPGRWSLLMLVQDNQGCRVAKTEDTHSPQGETLSQVAVPADC
ncbi:hypothetical protein ABS642_10765 [Microbacterium sp. A8/3-1]|uniref:Secreted protein n=1 Tax=Microbacterium sp. A8/3-1 TaxID=3160749 RepID=A0AAU7W1T5_9MICO